MMKVNCFLLIFVGWLNIENALTIASDTSIYKTLQQRFNENSLARFDSSVQLDTIIQKLDKNGKWSDLDYDNQSSSRWESAVHWDRIMLMTQAYRSPQHTTFRDAALKNNILKALVWWNNQTLASKNYWRNAIGVPLQMGEILKMKPSRCKLPSMENTIIKAAIG